MGQIKVAATWAVRKNKTLCNSPLYTFICRKKYFRTSCLGVQQEAAWFVISSSLIIIKNVKDLILIVYTNF